MLRAAGDWQRAKDVDVKKFQGSLEAGNRVIQRSIETDNSARSVRRLGLIHDVAHDRCRHTVVPSLVTQLGRISHSTYMRKAPYMLQRDRRRKIKILTYPTHRLSLV